MTGRTPAAQYIRMSTEHQRYSPLNQAAAIAAYAEQRGYHIVATYEDQGRSGVTLKGRDGLKRLLSDVLGRSSGFEAILVLDVSRWGRFQDPDQAAHYEFLCREAGVQVRYCSEPFENDGTAVTALVKQMKRVMAGEYSRELGTKTLAGALTGTRLGFKQGGPAVYGLKRMVVDPDRRPVMILGLGERRGRASDRVVYVKGAPAEVAVVRRIFREYIRGVGVNALQRSLKADGVRDDAGRPFTRHRILLTLQQRLYTGIYTYNRTTQRLQGPKSANPATEWVSVHMLEPIVPRRVFDKAQVLLASRVGKSFKALYGGRWTREEVVAHLNKVWQVHGRITHDLINSTPGPSSQSALGKFGTLQDAYLAVGYTDFDKRRFSVFRFSREQMVEGLKCILQRHEHLSAELINDEPGIPSAQVYRERFGGLIKAYEAAGWTPRAPLNGLGTIRRARALRSMARTAGESFSTGPGSSGRVLAPS